MSHDDAFSDHEADAVTSSLEDGAPRPPRPGLEPHPIRLTPLAFGLAFAVVATVGLTDVSSGDAVGWMWVVALVVFGLAGVVAGVSRRS